MWSLGALGFAAPWALAGLALLPILYFLLRVTPPAPRRLDFPAVRLLFGLDAREDTAARTPPWVLALRLLLAALFILAMAHPLIHPGQPLARTGLPLVLVVDDGWAAARDWSRRRAALDDVLARAERAGRPVIVLATAPPEDGSAIAASPALPAPEARALVQALTPKPWPGDLGAALAAVRALPRERVTQAIWLSDGLDDGQGEALARALQSLGGGLEIIQGRSGRVVLPPDAEGGGLNVKARRLAGLDEPERVALRALDGEGRVLAREEAAFAPAQAELSVPLRLPADLRNRVARLDLEDERGAASVALLDQRWRRRAVGLAQAEDGAAPLLAPLYYVERALSPHADLRRGEISELLAAKPDLLVLADTPAIVGTTADKLAAWVDQGGVLLRFAGPNLARAAAEGGADPLLPVRLRAGGRSLGGAMSWTVPQEMAPFPADGPFAGLSIPAEVRVTSQVLAEPGLDLAERSWARLADGTPLVTGEKRGKGWVVLVHSTANAEWTNLPLSGLFVDMLRRIEGLAEGSGKTNGPLPPREVLDGFGRLGAPGPAAIALQGDAKPGPRHPPGFYGDAGARQAFNLGPAIGRPGLLRPPPGVTLSALGAQAAELDLKPGLLVAALVLAMVDLLVALSLRGLLRRGAAALLALLLAAPAQAADSFAMEATLSTRLAYVRTGDAATDRKSHSGLAALSRLIGQRSTAQLAEPMAVDLERDPVLFFPVLYWPLSPPQRPLSAAASDKLNAYMARGGMIVLDHGGDQPDEARLRQLTENLAIPPLQQVTEDHVLTRSFYLLKEMPGRFDAGPVWVGGGSANDGVSPVVVGANDWAGAWATDDKGRPLLATAPGGERQRELAYRFGMNLVMYALTGNYKADQVHLPAILERLGR